ncbi:hypothetical protein HK096_005662, partial [Nowakowskiella sp. JEL0078]
WNINKLQDIKTRDEYARRIKTREVEILNTLQDNATLITSRQIITQSQAQTIIDAMWNTIKVTIDEAADNTIGKSPARRPTKDVMWDEEMKELQRIRKTAQQALDQLYPDDLMWEESKEKVKIAKKNFKQTFHRKKKEGFEKWTESIHTLPPSTAIKLISSARRHRERKEQASTLQPTTEHLAQTRRALSKNSQEEPNQVNPDPRPIQLSETPYQPEAALINIPLKTVIKAIMATPSGKASGTDDIRAELLKPAVPTIVKWPQYLALTMISRQISLSKWNKVNIHPIWKGKVLQIHTVP